MDWGRYGRLPGIFVADKEDVAAVIGREKVYLGEILGKHSEVVLDVIEEEYLRMLTDDPAAVEMFEKYNLATGYNLIEIIKEREEEE